MIQKKSQQIEHATTEDKPSEDTKSFKIGKRGATPSVAEADEVEHLAVVDVASNSRRRLSVDIDSQAHYNLKCYAVYTGESITATLNNLIYTHCPIKITA